jgi:hypothetical protein
MFATGSAWSYRSSGQHPKRFGRLLGEDKRRLNGLEMDEHEYGVR